MQISRKVFLLSAAVMGSSMIVACSGSSGSSSTNEFSSLPEVTGPVSGNGTSSIGGLLASTGTKLSSPGTFSNGTSIQMCENVNQLRDVLKQASDPDKILCYMGKMKATSVLPASLNLGDGEFHYVKLTNLPSDSKPIHAANAEISNPRVKFKIVKSGTSISSFVMYSCFGGTNDSPVQTEYISQTFSGTTATVLSKNAGTQGTQTYGSSLTATGEFTTSWQSKNISGSRSFSDSSDSSSNSMSINMDQYSDHIKMAIAMNGTYGGNTFVNRFYTVAQILNATSLATLALGNGSAKYNMSYSGGGSFSETSIKSWNGDTKAIVSPATDGDYYTLANAGTIPASPSITTITFTGDEAWDCSLPSGESWVDANFTNGGTAIRTGMSACDDKFLSDNNWLNCPY